MKLFIATTLVFSFALISCAQKNKSETAAQPAKTAQKATKTEATLANNGATQTVKCTNGNDHRTIDLFKVGSGCEVNYTKLGETKSIATSSSGMAYCESVQNKVKSNLSGAGYNCN